MGFTVFMKANERRRDIILCHQYAGVTRILGRNNINSF